MIDCASLAGLKVIELGDSAAAGFCCMMLGLLGADVTRLVEPAREEGESLRRRAERIYLDASKHVVAAADEATLHAYDVVVHGVARSRGQESVDRLLAEHAALTSQSQGLVYVALTPFGLRGGFAACAGSDVNAQAVSGGPSVAGDPDEAPLICGFAMCEFQHGLGAAAACVAALLDRTVSGRGQLVDVAEADVIASSIRMYKGAYTQLGIQMIRSGHRAAGSSGRYPHVMLPCKDGSIMTICRTEDEWNRFLAMMGNPSWAAEPRYRDFHAMAMDYPDEVDALIVPWLLERTKAELSELAVRHRVPLAPVRSAGEVLGDPQLAFRRFFREVVDNGASVRIPGLPVSWTRAGDPASNPSD